jgi:RNA recognition motif-containing protein
MAMAQQQQAQAQNPQNSIYVGNIAWKTTEQEIGDTFANFGYVNSVKIITDKETGRSKGFGFVEFSDRGVIQSVIKQMNGYTLNGRQLRVNQASGVKQNNHPQQHQQQQQNQFAQQQFMGQIPQQQFMNQSHMGGNPQMIYQQAGGFPVQQ